MDYEKIVRKKVKLNHLKKLTLLDIAKGPKFKNFLDIPKFY